MLRVMVTAAVALSSLLFEVGQASANPCTARCRDQARVCRAECKVAHPYRGPGRTRCYDRCALRKEKCHQRC